MIHVTFVMIHPDLCDFCWLTGGAKIDAAAEIDFFDDASAALRAGFAAGSQPGQRGKAAGIATEVFLGRPAARLTIAWSVSCMAV